MDTKEIAQDTINILKKGKYRTPDGKWIDLSDALERCKQQTRCYNPEQLNAISDHVRVKASEVDRETEIEVNNETTLEGSRRLATGEEFEKIGVLNFASARNPGGGFLQGARAQEESLARSSGLFASLKQCPSYYEYHRSHRSALYSDRMIWSPGCPVFRTDDGTLLEEYYTVDFITSPAPNAGVIRRNEPENKSEIEPVLRERSAKILSLAAHHGNDALVLGAWGCGVFQNDPERVARIFRNHLGRTGSFHNRFKKVVFSVLDTSRPGETVIRPFKEMLA
ncbi:MAG: TIGR02452 family protein [Balneolaceae bacterium]|nr:TIGR02452 family protein [Balneolaceae bacterium]